MFLNIKNYFKVFLTKQRFVLGLTVINIFVPNISFIYENYYYLLFVATPRPLHNGEQLYSNCADVSPENL